jgi:hypothetical protein
MFKESSTHVAKSIKVSSRYRFAPTASPGYASTLRRRRQALAKSEELEKTSAASAG